MTYNVFSGTLNLTQPSTNLFMCFVRFFYFMLLRCSLVVIFSRSCVLLLRSYASCLLCMFDSVYGFRVRFPVVKVTSASFAKSRTPAGHLY